MKPLSTVILCCCLNTLLCGQQAVELPIIVDFGKRTPSALTTSNVNVEVNGQPVAVEAINPVAGQHLQYALMNAEVQAARWPRGSQQQIDIATKFLRQVVRPGLDIGSLVNFSDEFYLDSWNEKDPGRLAFMLANDRGGPAMYDAVIATASQLAHDPSVPGYRKVIFLFCDGEDRQSRFKLDGATEALQRFRIPLFAFAPSAVESKSQGKNLRKLALATGGRAYFLADDTSKVNFDALKRDLTNSFLLRISFSLTPAMANVSITEASQVKIPIIGPSRIGLPKSYGQLKSTDSGQTASVKPLSKKPQFTEEQLTKLYAECSTYAATKVEDLESKRISLPPHECAAVLGWMRDSRVERLYPSEKPSQ